MSKYIINPVISFLITLAFSYIINKISRRFYLLDNPVARSNHTDPTPRTGGVAILLTLLLAYIFGFFENQKFNQIMIISFLAFFIGALDDISNVSPYFRLVCQFIVSFLLIKIIYLDYSVFREDNFINAYYFSCLIILLISIVWWINVVNFMDGIDGLAASQSIFILISVFFLDYFTYHGLATEDRIIQYDILIVIGSIAGFLYLNWSPASLFMGDSGSYGIATITAGVGLYEYSTHGIGFDTIFILAAVFIVDASFTLIKRIYNGSNILSSHNEHCYQIAVRNLPFHRTFSHRTVSTIVLIINLIWLFPLSVLDIFIPGQRICMLAISYIPLIMLYWYISFKFDDK